MNRVAASPRVATKPQGKFAHRTAILLASIALLTACAPSTIAIQTAIAETQQMLPATAMAETATPVATASSTMTVTSSSTPTDTLTPVPSDTSTVTITPTPSHTSTPSQTPTVTLTPSITPTHAPGIGDPFECGNRFTITVLEPLRFVSQIGSYNAVDKFAVIKVEFINNMSAAYDELNNENYILEGSLNGKMLAFIPNNLASLRLTDEAKLPDFFDDIPPSVPWGTMVAFDVNSSATNWALVVKPGLIKGIVAPICTVRIPLR